MFSSSRCSKDAFIRSYIDIDMILGIPSTEYGGFCVKQKRHTGCEWHHSLDKLRARPRTCTRYSTYNRQANIHNTRETIRWCRIVLSNAISANRWCVKVSSKRTTFCASADARVRRDYVLKSRPKCIQTAIWWWWRNVSNTWRLALR